MADYINVNKEVLIWTRNLSRLSLEDASKRSKINEEELRKLESGDKKPNLKELNALAKTYNKSLATLLLYIPPKDKPLPKDRRTVNSEQLGIFNPKTIQVVEKARALLYSFIELKEELGLPITKFSYQASLSNAPTEIAKNLREEWKLDEVKELQSINLALEGFIEIIENLGVVIFQMPLTKDNLRGFSIVDEKLPIIVIKRGNEPPTAKIFTLFHEVGHILLHEGGICDIRIHNQKQEIEKWCNAFAAEILVPSEVLLQNNIVKKYMSIGDKEWTSADLIEIGNFFFVGRLVILRKLYELNLTTPDYYEEKHNAWNKPSFGRAKEPKGRDIPREIIYERGKTFISLAFRAFEQNKINLKELSDYLGAKLGYIPKIRQHLYEF